MAILALGAPLGGSSRLKCPPSRFWEGVGVEGGSANIGGVVGRLPPGVPGRWIRRTVLAVKLTLRSDGPCDESEGPREDPVAM